MKRPAPTFKIVRAFLRGPWGKGRKYTIARGLTEAQAQAHCRDPESSSSTAQGANARHRTKVRGPWFDGYEEEKPCRK